jgi:hypothetical protein
MISSLTWRASDLTVSKLRFAFVVMPGQRYALDGQTNEMSELLDRPVIRKAR